MIKKKKKVGERGGKKNTLSKDWAKSCKPIRRIHRGILLKVELVTGPIYPPLKTLALISECDFMGYLQL